MAMIKSQQSNSSNRRRKSNTPPRRRRGSTGDNQNSQRSKDKSGSSLSSSSDHHVQSGRYHELDEPTKRHQSMPPFHVESVDGKKHRPRFFIPGINGRARTLTDDVASQRECFVVNEANQPVSLEESLRKPRRKSSAATATTTSNDEDSGTSSDSGSHHDNDHSDENDGHEPLPVTSTMSRRSSGGLSLKDEHFSKMLHELQIKRKAADVARKNAVKVKRRFEKLLSEQQQQGHGGNMEEEDEHLYMFERNMKSIRKQLKKYGHA